MVIVVQARRFAYGFHTGKGTAFTVGDEPKAARPALMIAAGPPNRPPGLVLRFIIPVPLYRAVAHFLRPTVERQLSAAKGAGAFHTYAVGIARP